MLIDQCQALALAKRQPRHTMRDRIRQKKFLEAGSNCSQVYYP